MELIQEKNIRGKPHVAYISNRLYFDLEEIKEMQSLEPFAFMERIGRIVDHSLDTLLPSIAQAKSIVYPLRPSQPIFDYPRHYYAEYKDVQNEDGEWESIGVGEPIGEMKSQVGLYTQLLADMEVEK